MKLAICQHTPVLYVLRQWNLKVHGRPWFTTQLTISATMIGIFSFLVFSYCRTRRPLLFAPRTKLKGSSYSKNDVRRLKCRINCGCLMWRTSEFIKRSLRIRRWNLKIMGVRVLGLLWVRWCARLSLGASKQHNLMRGRSIQPKSETRRSGRAQADVDFGKGKGF
jgi:hypothetical protein